MQEKVVYLYQNRTSEWIAGDDVEVSRLPDAVLPQLLPQLMTDGWKIREVITTGGGHRGLSKTSDCGGCAAVRPGSPPAGKIAASDGPGLIVTVDPILMGVFEIDFVDTCFS